MAIDSRIACPIFNHGKVVALIQILIKLIAEAILFLTCFLNKALQNMAARRRYGAAQLSSPTPLQFVVSPLFTLVYCLEMRMLAESRSCNLVGIFYSQVCARRLGRSCFISPRLLFRPNASSPL